MSDTSQGPGWWLASDQKWYPPAPPRLPPPPRQPRKPTRFTRWFNRLASWQQVGLIVLVVVLIVGLVGGLKALGRDDEPSAEYLRVKDECTVEVLVAHPNLSADRRADVYTYSAYLNRCMADKMGVPIENLPSDKPVAGR